MSRAFYRDIVIQNGQQLSGFFHARDSLSIGIKIPSTFTGTGLCVLGCETPDGTYDVLWDKDNAVVGVAAPKAGRKYVLFLQYPYEYLKFAFYTGSPDATTDPTLSAQAAERAIRISAR